MKRTRFLANHLSVAVASVLLMQAANAAPKANLGTIEVNTYQGAKVKTNIVTTTTKSESTETDLRGLLAKEPAIGIGGGNGTSQYFYIRNMGQNSIDVKVDDAYSDSQIHYHQGRFMLDPALVKIVAVQKGAGAASAGIGATNGAIVAKTLDADDLLKNSQNPNYGARVQAGLATNNNHRSYGASAFGKQDLGGVTVDGVVAVNKVAESDYKAGKGFENKVTDNPHSSTVPYSALDKLSYLVKAGVGVENHHLSISRMNERHEGVRTVREEFTVTPTIGFERQEPRFRKTIQTTNNIEYEGKNLGVVDKAKVNAYDMTIARVSIDDSKNAYATGASKKPEDLAKVQGSTTNQVKIRGANVNLDSQISPDLLVKYGINYRNQKVLPNHFLIDGLVNQTKTDAGVYVEAIKEIGDVTATVGARYDRFDFKAMDGKNLKGGALSPSVGVIYEPHFAPGLKLSANHNYATRSPRLHDALMAHGKRRGRTSITSIADGTKAEKARNSEIGFNYTNGAFGLDGSYFWQHIDGALSNTDGRNAHVACGGQACYAEIFNAGKIENKGYELGASYNQNGLSAHLGVAHSTPKLYGEKLSDNPEYATNAGRTWTASLAYRFDNPNLEVGVRHKHAERSEGNVKAQFDPKTDTIIRQPYSTTDLFANYKPLNNDRLNVNFAINNIANKHYFAHDQRGKKPRTGDTLPAKGRDFRVAVNYQF